MDELKKTDLKSYEAPETKKTQVELEEGICTAGSATVNNPDADANGRIQTHDVNTDFDYTFSDSEWDR